MELSLKGKNALVCGSTQGIGKASAIELAELGASITLVARNEAKLRSVMAELDISAGQRHSYFVADFSNPDGLKTTVNTHVGAGNVYHILVNNTGGPSGGAVFSASLDDIERAMTAHLKCNHILVQAVGPGMKAAKYGRIINIISTSVKQPINGLGVSNTVRGAVANWSKTLANELGAFGITVNNVLPGATATERLASIITNKAKAIGKDSSSVEEAMKAEVPAGRIADPHEMGGAVAFLASPAASYINGVNLPVDGGRTKSL